MKRGFRVDLICRKTPLFHPLNKLSEPLWHHNKLQGRGWVCVCLWGWVNQHKGEGSFKNSYHTPSAPCLCLHLKARKGLNGQTDCTTLKTSEGGVGFVPSIPCSYIFYGVHRGHKDHWLPYTVPLFNVSWNNLFETHLVVEPLWKLRAVCHCHMTGYLESCA